MTNHSVPTPQATARRWAPGRSPATQHDALIVGAGFGGIGAAIQLRRMGFDDLCILDREDDLGGTWHVNRYPGLAVDIPSSTYSFSFAPNPGWSRLFAPGEELKAYAGHVADTHDLRRHMRFGVTVTAARWDDRAGHWCVETDDGRTHTATYVVPATGFLSQPKLPDIEGIGTFAGQVLHTTDWDEAVDLRGVRVGLIGTGATGVQLIPEVADVAAHLTVYQRTPIWVAPKPDLPIPPAVRTLFQHVPTTQRLVRAGGTAVLEALMIGGVINHRDLQVTNRVAEQLCRAHLQRQVRDPALRRDLTPDYSFGCKRPTFSNTYYPALTKDHVHLETTPIDRVDADGIVTVDGARTDLDVLVLATGFNLWDVNFPAFTVVGRGGRDLGDWWRQNRFQAYEGITVPGFPNLLSLNSPYAYSGLSYFMTIECQMAHMARLFGAMADRGATVFEVSEEANARFLADMTARVEDTVFMRGQCATANSYYFNPHGEATLLRPTSTAAARRAADRFPVDDYRYRRPPGPSRTGRRSGRPRRGLVVGCGGTLGFAWSAVALQAVERALGWDARTAEVLVGTSSGAELVAFLGAGHPTDDIVEGLAGRASASEVNVHLAAPAGRFPPPPRPGLPALGLLRAGVRGDVDLLAAALGALPHGRGRPTWLRTLGADLAGSGGWVDHPATWIVAADAATGDRVALGAPDAPRVPLGEALAASWAIPGWFPPVTIGQRDHVDGGVVSAASADLVADLDLDEVVVLAPMATAGGARAGGLARLERVVRRRMTAGLDAEVATLEAAGVRVARVEPDQEDLEAMGFNFMDARRRDDVVRTARRTTPARVRAALMAGAIA